MFNEGFENSAAELLHQHYVVRVLPEYRWMALQAYELTVKPIAPFQFTPHLDRFTLREKPTPFLWLKEENLLRLAIRVGGGFAALDAVFLAEPWRPVVRLRVYADSVERAEEAKRVFANMIRANFDYRRFMDAVRSLDERLYGLAARYPGLRPGRCMNFYAALIDSVVKQKIALPIALRIYSKLVESYGARIAAGGTVYYWHPLPERLAKASIEELRGLGLTRVKARALREIALAELEKRLPSIQEAMRSPDTIVKELAKLYGVGSWTAQLAVAMVSEEFPLGPVNDLAVVRGLANILGLGEDEAKTMARYLLERLPGFSGLVLYLAAYKYESLKKVKKDRGNRS